MTRQINLSIGSVWRNYYTLEVFIDGSNVFCKIARIFYGNKDEQLKNFAEKKLTPVKVSEEWLAELDTFDIFSWRKEYADFPDGPDGIWWRLTFTDGDKTYRGHGWNIAHENWTRFMDWLGVIFVEVSK